MAGKRWILPIEEVVTIQRRVLRLIHAYMRANLADSTLAGANGGMMTWGELRQHVREAANLKVSRARKPEKRKRP